jgi:hypothetical protein
MAQILEFPYLGGTDWLWEPPLDPVQLGKRYSAPVVVAEPESNDSFRVDWEAIQSAWASGAYFVLLLAGTRFYCLPDVVIQQIAYGKGRDSRMLLRPPGQLCAEGGIAYIWPFLDRSPKETMQFLRDAHTRLGSRRKRYLPWGWVRQECG